MTVAHASIGAVAVHNIDDTARDAAVAQWGVAAVVMGGSMAAGGYTFHYLHEPALLGVVTAFAVDLALAMWLRIAGRLRALGVRSLLGWALEFTAMSMTLYLNIGAAVFRGGVSAAAERWALGVAHSFLPIVLVLVTLAGSEAQLRLLRLRREQEELGAMQELRRARGELADATGLLDKARGLREQAQRERATTEEEVRATQVAVQRLAKAQQRATTNGEGARNKTAPASRAERREWVRQERAAGHMPTGAAVDKRFGPPRTGAAIVAEVETELRRTPLRSVTR